MSSLFEGYYDYSVTSIGALYPSIPTSTVCYDLIPLLHPDTYFCDPLFKRYYAGKLAFLHKASLVLCISDFSRLELLDTTEYPPQQAHTIGAAVSASFRPLALGEVEGQAILDRLGLKRQFILYTGGADDRKNLFVLLQAFAGLPQSLRRKHQLVLAGKMPPTVSAKLTAYAAAQGIAPDELRLTGYITDQDLLYLYNLCILTILPSLHEGFGLTVLEAMKCHAAVIASDVTSIPEVIGCKEALFNPRSPGAITALLHKTLTDTAFREALRRRGAQKAREFSWDTVASRALAAFETLGGRDRKIAPGRPAAAQGQTAQTGTPWQPALLRDLYQALAAIREGQPSKADRLDAARAIAQNLHNAPGRQLLVDVSGLLQPAFGSDRQRQAQDFLLALDDAPPPDFYVVPVYATAAHGYRYAGQTVTPWRKSPTHPDAEHALRYFPGDVFFGLATPPDVLAREEHAYRQWQRAGVVVTFPPADTAPAAQTMTATQLKEYLHAQAPTRQFLVDISELVRHNAQTGIQRVVGAVMSELVRQPPAGYRVEPVYATMEQPGYRYANAFAAATLGMADRDPFDRPIEYGPGDVFLGLDLRPELIPFQEGFFQQLRNNGVGVYFVVYDLLCLEMPDAFIPIVRQLFPVWLATVVRQSGAVCISRSVAGQLQAWVAANAPDRLDDFAIGWFHLGADLEHALPSTGLPDTAQSVLDALAKTTSFLMVGTIEPRKDHVLALDAFERLWASGQALTLVIAGKPGWQVE